MNLFSIFGGAPLMALMRYAIGVAAGAAITKGWLTPADAKTVGDAVLQIGGVLAAGGVAYIGASKATPAARMQAVAKLPGVSVAVPTKSGVIEAHNERSAEVAATYYVPPDVAARDGAS